MPTAQNGWIASSDKAALGVDPNFNVNGIRFPGGVLRGDVSTVLHYVATQFHNRVEALVDGWCWGYSYRPISGSASLSNHSAACAIDCNAPNHPLGKANTFKPSQIATITAIVNECGGVVRWGGTYSRPDDMHFEIVGDKARVAAVAARLRGGGSPPPATPPGPLGTVAALQRGSKGDAVKRLQRVLNAWYPHLALSVDGDFGPSTEAGVKELQRRSGLTVDGIAGPKTLGALGLA